MGGAPGECILSAARVLKHGRVFWFCHVSDLEHEVVGVPPHVQVPVASVGGARQQRDSPPAKSRAVCGLQPLQHGGGHEHARPGERMLLYVYSLCLGVWFFCGWFMLIADFKHDSVSEWPHFFFAFMASHLMNQEGLLIT